MNNRLVVQSVRLIGGLLLGMTVFCCHGCGNDSSSKSDSPKSSPSKIESERVDKPHVKKTVQKTQKPIIKQPPKPVITQLPPQKPTPKKTFFVQVIVKKVLDAKTAQQIADQLFQLDDNYDVGDFVIRDGATLFFVFEVKDFETFRQKIQFAEIVSTDAKQRKIVIRLRQNKND